MADERHPVLQLLVPDDDHREDPGVHQVLDAVGDGVDGEVYGGVPLALLLPDRAEREALLGDPDLDVGQDLVGAEALGGGDEGVDRLPGVLYAPEALRRLVAWRWGFVLSVSRGKLDNAIAVLIFGMSLDGAILDLWKCVDSRFELSRMPHLILKT